MRTPTEVSEIDRITAYPAESRLYWISAHATSAAVITIGENDSEESNPALTDGDSDANEICVYDDTEANWAAFNSGAGSYVATVSEETTIKAKGTSSLKVAVGAGANADVGAKRSYGSNQNWSGKTFLQLYVRGASTNKTIRVTIDAPDTSNYLYYEFVDNSSAFKILRIPVTGMTTGSGAPNLTTVRALGVQWLAVASTFNSYVDRTILDKANYTELMSIGIPINTVRRMTFKPSIVAQNNLRINIMSGAAKVTLSRTDA